MKGLGGLAFRVRGDLGSMFRMGRTRATLYIGYEDS